MIEDLNKKNDFYGLKTEGRDLLKGIAGGLIFGMPTLYTMEVWYYGKTFNSMALLSVLLFILIINTGFCYFSGLRSSNQTLKLSRAVEDSLTSMAIALVLSMIILWLIGQIDFSTVGIEGNLGNILMEAVIMSVGITFTNSRFSSNSGNGRDLENEEQEKQDSKNLTNDEKQVKADLNDVAATVAGAVVFSFNVAPTEEVLLIAMSLSSLQLLMLLIAQLLICYTILYASGIAHHPVYEPDSVFQKPWFETIMALVLSLIVSGILIFFVGKPVSLQSLNTFIAATITLGLPAVVGGAAGRLII